MIQSLFNLKAMYLFSTPIAIGLWVAEPEGAVVVKYSMIMEPARISGMVTKWRVDCTEWPLPAYVVQKLGKHVSVWRLVR